MLLPRRLDDFSPRLIGADKPSELLFHADLSDDEMEYFERLRVECREWMNLVAEWETGREETCQDVGCVSQLLFQRLAPNLMPFPKTVSRRRGRELRE